MIDRDQLREALAYYDEFETKTPGWKLMPETAVIKEAARLVADPNTLTIAKVDGEWPRWVYAFQPFDELSLAHRFDALLEGQSK